LGAAGILKSATVTGVPKRDQTVTPNPMSTAAATKVPIPPRLFSHFPTLRPTILRTVSSASRAIDASMAKVLSSASAAWPAPMAKTETPTK
jgi:hypothetical protein